jgi:hypothetical protein
MNPSIVKPRLPPSSGGGLRRPGGRKSINRVFSGCKVSPYPFHLSLEKFFNSRPPLPSTGSLGFGSPLSSVLSADSDVSYPLRLHFVAFVPPYPALRSVRSDGYERSHRQPGPLGRRRPQRLFTGRAQDLPGSWGTLRLHADALGPRRIAHAKPFGAALLPCAQRTASAPPITLISRFYHFGLQTPCVRFAAEVTLAPRNTRFRLVANLGQYRNLTCRVPSEGFRHATSSTWLSPSPGLAWRNLRGGLFFIDRELVARFSNYIQLVTASFRCCK